MKYDRPVWQLMHLCADAMPEVFRYDDVRTWYAENYPEVGEATIRAHVVGLTEGGAKHPQFQRRSPVFRRVARGEYTSIPFEERGELPDDSTLHVERGVGAAEFFAALDRESAAPVVDPEDSESEPELEVSAGAEAFWPFPGGDEAEEPVVAATEARRKKREKVEKRDRKAARREAKRLAALEPEARVDPEAITPELVTPDSMTPEIVAELTGSGRPAWEIEIESERARLAAARLDASRREEEIEQARAVAEAEFEAERRRLSAEREEMARIAAERAESGRVASQEIEAERSRIAAERAEAGRLLAEQVEARSTDRQAVVRREAERTAVAQQEAERLQAERVEAERVTAVERKRVSKLRKAARKERELAEMLDRDRIERKARRKAERRAREGAERHLHEAAERRRREDEDRKLAAQSVREELARLEAEALGRIEAERAMRSRSEGEHLVADRDREAFERAEQERREFERDARERQQLEREEQQLHVSLRPMLDDQPPAAAPETPEHDDDLDSSSDPAGVAASAPPDSSHGGIVIVRAPRSASGPDEDEDVVVPVHIGDSRDDEAIVLNDASDAIVLGSLGERLGVPAPAKDAYRDLAFQLARRDAERSGSRWFVLSAEHGLLEPQEWVSPDDRAISDIDPRHRAVWASWVAARLELLVGDLHGLRIHVDAPDEIALPVLDALGEAGAETTTGTAIHVPTAAAHEVEQPVEDVPEEGEEGEPVDEVELNDVITPDVDDDVARTDSDGRPDAQVLPFLRISSVADHLTDSRNAVPAPLAAALPHHPGLYAWAVDHSGSRMLNRALMLPVRAGVIYVGQVGASTGLSDSMFSLNDHVTRVQLHGRARASTFRMNLATTLAELLGLHTIEDPRLTQWMLDHLSVTVWPTDDVAHLRELEESVVDDLRPVLNIDQDRAVEYRRRIAELRDRLA